MSQTLQINLNPNYREMQDYEIKGSNLMYASVQLPDVRDTKDRSYTICIALSVDGMLGLGMELIRNGVETKTTGGGLNEELLPIYPKSACQVLGIFLTHDSCRLVLGYRDLGTYLEEVKESRKKSNLKKVGESWGKKPNKRNFFSEQSSAGDQVFSMDLNTKWGSIQIYQENDANLMHLSVKLPNGEVIVGDDRCIVCLALDVDGMMGLGTELIRKAMRMKATGKKESPEIERLEPIGSEGGSSGSLGVYLTHDSCSLELSVKDLGTVDEQLKLNEKRLSSKGRT